MALRLAAVNSGSPAADHQVSDSATRPSRPPPLEHVTSSLQGVRHNLDGAWRSPRSPEGQGRDVHPGGTPNPWEPPKTEQEGRGFYTPAGNRAQTDERERGWGGNGEDCKAKTANGPCTVRGAEGLSACEARNHGTRWSTPPSAGGAASGRPLGKQVKPRFPHL